MAAQLATLLVLIAKHIACMEALPQPCAPAMLLSCPVVQPMRERHTTDVLSVSTRRSILLSLGA